MPDDPYLVVAADKGTATSPTTRTGSAASTDSGSTTRLHRAAPRATTTRRWASRRAAHGSPSSATSAKWASTRRPPTSPSPASATCRATCSATACCCRRTSGSSRRSTTGTSSSIPNPDPASSLRERERLFRLPRSTWADYDATLLSPGGGIHPRSAKSIAITPEVRAALDITADTLTPTELVNAILKAPVDLLYNGGIGTYVKATTETHARGRRSRQRRAARRRAGAALQGAGRGRQPRLHAARPHRVRAGGRTHLHRRDRQFRAASTRRITR